MVSLHVLTFIFLLVPHRVSSLGGWRISSSVRMRVFGSPGLQQRALNIALTTAIAWMPTGWSMPKTPSHAMVGTLMSTLMRVGLTVALFFFVDSGALWSWRSLGFLFGGGRNSTQAMVFPIGGTLSLPYHHPLVRPSCTDMLMR